MDVELTVFLPDEAKIYSESGRVDTVASENSNSLGAVDGEHDPRVPLTKSGGAEVVLRRVTSPE